MLRRILIFISLFISFACIHPAKQKEGSSVSQVEQALSGIKIEDGIDLAEAKIIIENYRYKYAQLGCGAVGDIQDKGEVWSSPVLFGYAAEPYGEITVSKKNGKTSWQKGPTVNDPRNIWK